VPVCAVAPEALAAPYAAHIGQPARAAGFLLMGIPAGTVAADIIAARLLATRLQRRIIVPAGLLAFAPLVAFAASPGLGLSLLLLVISGLGSAWAAGIDGLLIDTAPRGLRNRALALSAAGLMFTQGLGFALWGIAGQYAPLAVVIPVAAAAGTLAVVTLRPHRRLRPRRRISTSERPASRLEDSPAKAARGSARRLADGSVGQRASRHLMPYRTCGEKSCQEARSRQLIGFGDASAFVRRTVANGGPRAKARPDHPQGLCCTRLATIR